MHQAHWPPALPWNTPRAFPQGLLTSALLPGAFCPQSVSWPEFRCPFKCLFQKSHLGTLSRHCFLSPLKNSTCTLLVLVVIRLLFVPLEFQLLLSLVHHFHPWCMLILGRFLFWASQTALLCTVRSLHLCSRQKPSAILQLPVFSE